MNAASLLFGIGFGFVFGWSRLTDYDVIHDLLLHKFDLFLMTGAAVATAAVAVRLLRAWGARSLIGGLPISWSVAKPTRNHFLGAAIFGVGWRSRVPAPVRPPHSSAADNSRRRSLSPESSSASRSSAISNVAARSPPCRAPDRAQRRHARTLARTSCGPADQPFRE